MKYDNKLQVEAIKHGTVIDHIPAQVGFKLLSFFHLTQTDQRVTIGLNLPSCEMGRKDLIKIENTCLTDDQINQLAVYAPNATVNRIFEYQVVAKITPVLPDCIERVLTCPNSNCISRSEPVYSNFSVKERYKKLLLKCKYCEKEFTRQVVIDHW
ncbi:aspartate carbamoyltransferase regulatory subunit [Candidatus Pantoea carbekii]|uniref:Aspartate carbamoyltransferase regulatory chain n=1 Tax=Candidatus Pantoea carbekii TaxID=1235990 RepID=U3U9A9_9GAMM|nr:aspartate carbamoyltransferase regulatory subunit [Candidatus Pantoea carbekii]AKC31843.1 aspartate carbamoyltransferase regulatory chain PyrI [Candidatus Pantoea carbekii]BAO00353.1 PyrI protein [Candidatus Pantoea carbekii]